MSTKGIIFSAPMVRALLDGRKTQTRRILNPQPEIFEVEGGECEVGFFLDGRRRNRIVLGNVITLQAVPYVPGDRLYVREACRAEELSRPPTTRPATRLERNRLGRTSVTVCDVDDGRDGIRYMADNAFLAIQPTMLAGDRWSEMFYYRGRGKGRVGNQVPSIHMPRWASRLWLGVTEVRIERLQSISEADAIAEGIDTAATDHFGCPIKAYAALWDYLHGGESDHGWLANPWVVAVTFTVNRGNVDA